MVSGSFEPHYDICKSKRALAVAAGAQEIGWRDLATMIKRNRAARSDEVLNEARS